MDKRYDTSGRNSSQWPAGMLIVPEQPNMKINSSKVHRILIFLIHTIDNEPIPASGSAAITFTEGACHEKATGVDLR